MNSSLGSKNRDHKLPSIHFDDDYLNKTEDIFVKHQILYGFLVQFLNITNRHEGDDLYGILKNLKNSHNHNVEQLNNSNFRAIFDQRNEVYHQKYPIRRYESDVTLLDTVTKYLNDSLSNTSNATGNLNS